MARVFLSALALVAAASTASAISCGLVVPSNPLTAAGLATPYILTKAPNSNDNCTMSNPLHQVFVNAVVLDFDNNRLLSYTPLVIDEALLPKAEPTVVPALPTNSLVALFIATNFNAFGTINDSIVLLDDPKNTTSSSLYEGNCLPGVVRGGKIDSFLQFATCNSVEFFNKALAMAKAGSLYVPQLNTGKDGLICPTVRSFDLVDSTQSDTVPSSYILLANGVTVQNNDANLQKHKVGNGDNSLIFNESDAALLDSLDEVIGCSSWKIEDLTDPDKKPMVSNFAADELQAALFQPYPVALVPANDPDVLSAFGDRPPNLVKLNTYRAAVGQPPAATLDDAGKEFYCKALLSVGTKRLAAAKDLMTGKESHDRTMGVDLYTFWAARFLETFSDPNEGLGCKTVLSMPTDPVKCITNSSDTAYPDSCHSVEVAVSDPLGVYSTKAAATTTTTDNNGAVIGLAVSLGVVAIAGAAFIVFIYRRTHGFASLGSGGISLREV